jgi:hypothetical protein
METPRTFQVTCWPLAFFDPDVPPFYQDAFVLAPDAKEAAVKADSIYIPWALLPFTSEERRLMGTIHTGRRHLVTPVED